jgi:hypothetical protein
MGKHPSGFQKHKGIAKEEDLIPSQRGPTDRFITKKSQVSPIISRLILLSLHLILFLIMILVSTVILRQKIMFFFCE